MEEDELKHLQIEIENLTMLFDEESMFKTNKHKGCTRF